MGAFIKKLPGYWRYAIQIVALSFVLTTMPSTALAANGTVATVPPVSSWITWCGNFCESPIYSSAAEACSYYNSAGRTYTVSNVPYSELGMDYPGSFRCLVTTTLGTAYSGWVMSKGDWSCPANSTGSTTCTCNTNYVPDATGTSCVQCTPPSVFDTASGRCNLPCMPPNVIDSATGQCKPPDTYSITLTPDRPGTEPSTTLGFTVKIETQDHQAPKNPITVHLALKVGATSGGHAHGKSDRPRGGLNTTNCTSDAPCIDVSTSTQDTSKGNFTFHPTDAAGTHTITPSCERCSGQPVSVDVKVKEADAAGWDSLSESPSDYQLVGGEEGKKHHDNHYLTETARDHLQAIYDTYNEVYPEGPVLYLNDASLKWGGKFDISGEWVGAHVGHRRGKEIDIRANQEPTAISFWRFADFKKIAEKNGASASVHCSFPNAYSWACWFDMGKNRHFHVRLTGK